MLTVKPEKGHSDVDGEKQLTEAVISSTEERAEVADGVVDAEDVSVGKDDDDNEEEVEDNEQELDDQLVQNDDDSYYDEDYDDEEEEEEEEEGEEDDIDIAKERNSLEVELQKLMVMFPAMSEPVEIFKPSDFPQSYKENSKREKIILSYAENFRIQYVHLYPKRKPLLLSPVNEFGIKKFVCTTIRPALLRFPELYNWSEAAKFVANHLQYIPLHPAFDLPNRLYSPSTVLSLKKGHCFDYATLLASLLLGVGYDAYVVSGYAVREICLIDESRDLCPLLLPPPETVLPPPDVVKRKYAVRPPRDLTSKYEMWMESRRLKAIAIEEAKKQKEEDDKILMSELPPVDPLRGWCIHAWILILDGKREVGKPFFIEPLTGVSHSVLSPLFLGIESIWNQYNYWVNMQDCSEGLGNMLYDLTDWTLWEYLIPSNVKTSIIVKVNKEEDIVCRDEFKEKDEDIESHLDLPPPWVKGLCLTAEDFEQRYPNGSKVTIYKRAKVEDFAPYLLSDGLVRRISIYEDLDMKNLLQVKEFYANRADKLTLKLTDYVTSWISKYFDPGRLRHLKEYHCKAVGEVLHAERTMVFYHKARLDCLEKRVETSLEMTEYYVDRNDFLGYCYVKYGGEPLKFGHVETTQRPIEKLIARYDRNPSKPANDDIKEIIYSVLENKDIVSYHYEDDKITYSTREFIKPDLDDIKGTIINWNNDNHSTYQVVSSRPDKKRYEVYQMMLDLLRSEEACFDHVLESQRDVRYLLNELAKEEVTCTLDVAVHDIRRNDKAQKRRRRLEQRKLEEEQAKQEVEPDFMAPFISQLFNDEQSPGTQESSSITLPKEDEPTETSMLGRKQVTIDVELIPTQQRAYSLRKLCLADFKRRMVDMANLMQASLEKETDNLLRKQNWYQQNQIDLEKEEEQKYLSYCSDTLLRIRVLEARLNRHKETAPLRYQALDQKIKSDPRLAPFF